MSLVAAMAALTGSQAEPEVLGTHDDVVVVRVGDVVAKAHAEGTDVEALAARMRIAADLPGLMLPPISPEPVEIDGRPVTLWPYGTPVSQADPDRAPWEESATLLARLHAIPFDGLPSTAHDRILRAVHALPPEAPGADLVLRAFATLPPLELPGSSLIHGDYHLGQLVHRDEWLLIDVDDLGAGAPVWDLARPAALYAAGILPADLWTRFLDAYRSAGGIALPGEPWAILDVPARAFIVQMAARAIIMNTDAKDALLETCDRIVASAHG
ncbi:aminoglycoside phosphotransferase [Lentzea sp. NBRC 105346]|uniref:phosphotransferase family protein n=1 Tax=Lentzea sp. NBRC 105346 TaxID=3032205 RepID=UPI0025571796|nr:phosphotransferase [Lentzea sp. NBRC 105346]GLZ30537.1 aminoglycoside phosphotransferase [Lentzea sp. NBRC 105346]